MIRFSKFSASSLGKKIYMSVLGLLLSGFLVVHLLGNLALLSPDKDKLNLYSHFLTHSLATPILIAEVLLALMFLLHFIYALWVQIGNWLARPIGYKMVTNAGGASKKSLFSTTMIWSGLIIIVFVVIHLFNFKYGEEIMYTTASGQYIRDMYQTVVNFYSNFWNVVFYDVVMIALGFHLAHAFWSAFQSLGLNAPRFIKFVQGFGYLFALVISVGFFIIPIWIYLTGGAQ